MFLPSVIVQADDIVAIRLIRSSAISACMAAMLIVIAMIILELGLQVSRSPEECLIQ